MSSDGNKLSPMVFDGNITENWKRWKQRFSIHLLARGKDDKDVKEQVKIAILLDSIGDDGIEVYNSFAFSETEENALTLVFDRKIRRVLYSSQECNYGDVQIS